MANSLIDSKNIIQAHPVHIIDEDCNLYGILRGPVNSDLLVILLPAMTGCRTGPQNLYVEIARDLEKIGVASLCIDIPPTGDSYDILEIELTGSFKEKCINKYHFYLEKITSFLDSKFKFEEVILLSISIGCIPILNYSIGKKYSRTILLSPNHFPEKKAISVNNKNLRSYGNKFFEAKTWLKLISFRLNFKKILSNTLKVSLTQNKSRQKTFTINQFDNPMNILIIFGEKDDLLKENILFWENFNNDGQAFLIESRIISNSDHSFYGWKFKKDVINTINSFFQRR